MRAWIDQLAAGGTLSREELTALIEGRTPQLAEYLFSLARQVCERYYGDQVYLRGLIEFSSFCKNDCYYCGLRCSNRQAQRYRLSAEEIWDCCQVGYQLGFRTFVLQSGEDPWYTDEKLVEIVSGIHRRWSDCAITLSLGERSAESYQALFDAGANRYLLRHEAANPWLYGHLHPARQRLADRMECLSQLKRIGYQVGAGFMVGAPGQTAAHLADDLLYLQQLQPHMVGIGPFIPHHDTPFAGEPAGSLELTLFLLGLTRLMLPSVLLPATTALGTLAEDGRELGMRSGANVIMPNLSPKEVREKYLLYDNKRCTGDEAAEYHQEFSRRMATVGRRISLERGDWQPVPLTER